MALQKQHIQINLGQGVDQSTDEKLVVPGKLLDLKNGVFVKGGRIDKRNGYSLLSNQKVDNTFISGGDSLQVFNNELLQYNNQKLYSLASGNQKWIDKGAVVSTAVTTKQILKNTASQTHADWATKNGVSVYAYEDTRGGIRALVFDETSGTTIIPDTSLDAAASRCRCYAFNQHLYVVYYKAGSLWSRRISFVSPLAFEPAIELVNDINTTNPNFDLLPFQNLRVCLVHNVEGASETRILWLDEDSAVLQGTLAPKTIAEASTNCLGVILGPINSFHVVYHNASGLRCAVRNLGGASITAPTTVDSYTSTDIVNVTGFSDGAKVIYFYEVSNATPSNTIVKTNNMTNNGTVGSATVFMRSVGLWSKAFIEQSTGLGYVAVTHKSAEQSSYFLTRQDGLITGRFFYTNGAGLTTRPILSNVQSFVSGKYSFCALNTVDLVSQDTSLFSLLGVSNVEIDFTNLDNFTASQIGNNLHIVGGALSMYDGQSVVEHGFHLFPEGLSASTSGSSGVGNGDYQYVAVYEWVDNQGYYHRSAPSLPLNVTVSGGHKNVTVTIPTLRLTNKIAPRTPVSIVLYRTEDGPGEVFFRVSSISSPTYNDTTVDSVAIVDTTPDASLISNELLYTTGGILENISPPSCKLIEQFKDRIFLAGLENPYQVAYSKQHAAGEPVEFNNLLALDLASDGGPVTALAVLDDKLLIFKSDRVFVTFGDGPNNAGLGGEFANVQFISADVGCISQQSVARFPGGVIFKSKKGIYMIDSSMNMQYIGAEVEDFNSLNITSANLMSNVNQIRFTTSDGPCLVYDYFFRQWSTFDPYAANDAVVLGGNYIFMNRSGDVLMEDSGYRDNNAGISLSLTTSWLSFDSIVGFQRVYSLLIVGSFKSYHKLRVSVGYDFSKTYQSVYIMDTNDAIGSGVYGGTSPFGNDPKFGGESNDYRLAFGMDIQKCTAIRFKIEDITVAETVGTGEAFNITALGVLVGIKGQMDKFADKRVIPSR